MTSDRPMRLALLGCGYAAQLHAKTLKSLRKDVVVTYASRDVGTAKQFNDKYAGAGWFGSYADAIASDDVDVVAILSPPAYHLDLTLEALAAGKDVIVEKPPFMHASDFDAVEEACVEHRRRVFVAENYYYKPLAIKLRKLLADGAIGDVLFVQLNAVKTQQTEGWREDKALTGTGALFEGGIHWVNFLANLGLTVQRVRGARPGKSFLSGDSNGAVERSMLVTFEYAEGAVATLQYSWDVPGVSPLRMSRIYGTKGSIRFETNGVFLAVTGANKSLSIPGLRDLPGYKAMFKDFLHAWRTGEEPGMDLAKARRDLELVETAYATASIPREQD